jgi:hypothetical protein
MPLDATLLDELLNAEVVVDVAAPYVYLGTFAGSDHHYLVLDNADVHDLRDTATTRDLYVLDARRHGINVNRTRVLVNRDQVVGLSRLADVSQ